VGTGGADGIDPWPYIPAVEEAAGRRRRRQPGRPQTPPSPPASRSQGRSPRPRSLPRPPRWRWLLVAAAGVAAAVFVASTDSGGRGHPRPPAASPAPGGPQVIISPPGQGGSGSGPQTAANLAPAGFIGPQVSFAGTKAWLIANVSLYVSGNGGRTWQLKLRGDGPLGEPLNVGFWSSAGGWVSTQSADGAQQMYLTGDQGAHWRRIALPFGTGAPPFSAPPTADGRGRGRPLRAP
jgi:hypothetical protein